MGSPGIIRRFGKLRYAPSIMCSQRGFAPPGRSKVLFTSRPMSRRSTRCASSRFPGPRRSSPWRGFSSWGGGTAAFMITYGVQGGFESLSGVLMGAGILGIGLLVLAFGAVTVVLSYRLENSRLAQVYEELKAVVDDTPVRTSAR